MAWINARSVGSEVTRTDEEYTVGEHESGFVLPRGLALSEGPSSASADYWDGDSWEPLTEVTDPEAVLGATEFRVRYEVDEPEAPLRGAWEFGAADDTLVRITYEDRGSLLWAHDTNRFDGGIRVRLARIELTEAAASITFSDIPQGYRNLYWVVYARATSAGTAAGLFMRLNGDTGSNYDRMVRVDTTAGVAVVENIAISSGVVGEIAAATTGADLFTHSCGEVYNYANAIHEKVFTGYSELKKAESSGNLTQRRASNFWRDTDPVEGVTFFPNGDLIAGSYAEIWGTPL